MTGSFKDHFSRIAGSYATFRPHYPEELFAHLAGLCAQCDLAVDCGTGNGQAAIRLAAHFAKVVAIDPSAEQIAAAIAHERVLYAVVPAERMPVDDKSADLITAAAAAHWFPHDAFHAEVRRVLKPGGIVALWTYSAYRELPFPFRDLPLPTMDIRMTWSLEHFIGYLGTWSAVERYRSAHGTDPIDLVRNDLRAAWGEGERPVRWPLAMRVGRV
jgi:ubiquinone/menaquinone biosynthesis C-methylase UbiE